MRIELSTFAQQQVEEIHQYIWLEFGGRYADNYLDALNAKFANLQDFPSMYPIHLFASGYAIRTFNVGRSSVFYIVSDDMIYVPLICDSRQSPQKVRKKLIQELNKIQNNIEIKTYY